MLAIRWTAPGRDSKWYEYMQSKAREECPRGERARGGGRKGTGVKGNGGETEKTLSQLVLCAKLTWYTALHSW